MTHEIFVQSYVFTLITFPHLRTLLKCIFETLNISIDREKTIPTKENEFGFETKVSLIQEIQFEMKSKYFSENNFYFVVDVMCFEMLQLK